MLHFLSLPLLLLCLLGNAAASDLPLVAGTYVSSTPAQAIGLAIDARAGVVVGINRNPASGFPSGSGELQFWPAGAASLPQLQSLGGTLRAFAADSGGSGRWIAGGSFGVVLSNADGSAAGLSLPLSGLIGAPERLALCGGHFALLRATQVALYESSGALRGQFTVDATRVADVACEADGSRVYVTGDREASATLRMAYAEAYSPGGTRLWRAWGHTAAQAQSANSLADTDGRRILRASDGGLYVAARTDGGNNVFRFRPQNLAQNAPNVFFDAHNQTFQLSGAPSLGYYARLDPQDGSLLRGQYVLSRLANGNGNSVGLDALAVAADGALLLGGQAFASLANRAALTVAGQPIGAYSGGDPFLLAIPPDFASRRYWHPPVGDSGRGVTRALASRGGITAMLVEANQGQMITVGAVIPHSALGFTPASATPAVWLGLSGNSRLFGNGFEAP
ncbi:MAG: hypothetical protein MUE46_13075 [Xanthomonadales bacterium]|jgi:hypothetical protein|nr:hypothetical protein [Xanthomonadales bacterium]